MVTAVRFGVTGVFCLGFLFACPVDLLSGDRRQSVLEELKIALAKQDIATAKTILAGMEDVHTKTQAVPYVIAGLRSRKDDPSRCLIISLFDILGENARSAVPEVLRFRNSPTPVVRMGVLDALCAIDPKSQSTSKTLINAIRDSDEDVRATALELLERLDEPTKPTDELLSSCLRDRSARVRAHASAFFLKRHPKDGNTRAVDALLDVLEHGDTASKCVAVTSVPLLGDKGPKAIPSLVKMMNGEELSTLRGNSILKLGSLKPQDKATISMVVARLHDSDRYVRLCAGVALSLIGPATVAPVTAELSSPDANVRQVVIQVLGNLGKASQGAVPLLRRVLINDENVDCREFASEALRKIEAQLK